jgi:steroid delta-isomerase-like uncharacterized protein
MSDDNKTIARRWFEEVWNKGRSEAIDRMFAVDGVAHGLAADGSDLRGPEAFKSFQHAYRTAFPDLKFKIEDLIAEDDKVANRWTATGTHTGDGLGFPATNRAVTVTGMGIIRLRNGQIVEVWNTFDALGMHQQLGTLSLLVPGSAAVRGISPRV